MIIKHASKAQHLFSDFPQVTAAALDCVPEFNTPEAISCWSANYFEVEGTPDRFLILFNEFIYTPILFLLSDDRGFSDFEAEFIEAIQRTWQAYGIPQHFTDACLAANTGIECMKLTDRNSIGKLTAAYSRFSYCDEDISSTSLFQPSFIAHYKRWLFKPTAGSLPRGVTGGYTTYSEWATAKNLEAGNYRAPEFFMYEIELEYLESDSKTLRTIEIPSFASFNTLHTCIQVAYLWSDYHIWDFLIASPNGLDEPQTRRPKSDNPLVPALEFQAIGAQPEIDYAFDASLKLKPLARIAPDYGEALDWMHDGVHNYYPSTSLDVFFDEDDYAVYSYDSGVGHTVRIHVTKRFKKDSGSIVCTEALGDARGEDGSLPLLSIDGTINVTDETPYDVPYLLTIMNLNKAASSKAIADLGGPKAFMMSILNASLQQKSS